MSTEMTPRQTGELMTEFLQGLLAEQRHTVLDADADSTFPVLVDNALCHHGRPLLTSQLDCPDCRAAQEGQHAPDWSRAGRCHTQFCRECGRSWGTHGGVIR